MPRYTPTQTGEDRTQHSDDNTLMTSGVSYIQLFDEPAFTAAVMVPGARG
jgi:hypothetical protein